MKDVDEIPPSDVLGDVESQREDALEYQKQAAEWFLSDTSPDGLVPREELLKELSGELSVTEPVANRVVSGLVGDVVDPVQQVTHPEKGKLVGVIEYHEYPDSGCYGYVNYDDVTGDAKRVVCSRCVETAEVDTDVTHATAGGGSMSEDAGWEQLVNRVEKHYANSHEVTPDSVTVGASLASGTTISGNTAFHLGNDGQGSGLDADTVDGKDAKDLGGVSTFVLSDKLGGSYNDYVTFNPNQLTASPTKLRVQVESVFVTRMAISYSGPGFSETLSTTTGSLSAVFTSPSTVERVGIDINTTLGNAVAFRTLTFYGLS